MNILTAADLRKLLIPLLLALVAIGCGFGLNWYVDQQTRAARAQLEGAKADRTRNREKLARISEEEREVKEKIEVYRRLVDTRVIGPERRLEWIDAIQRIRTGRELLDVRYRIEPQRALVSLPGKAGNVDFNSSAIRVELALLHEGDLIAFLSDLQGAGYAYAAPRRCVLSRTSTSASASPGTTLAPRLRADCQIDLITILDRGAKQ